MRKLRDEAVQRFQVAAMEKPPQPFEKLQFIGVQRPAVQVKPLRHPDAAMVPAAHRFDGIGTGQHRNVAADGADADAKFMSQICAGVVPTLVQNFQQLLAALPRVQIHFQFPFQILSVMFGLLVLAVAGKLFGGLFQTLHRFEIIPHGPHFLIIQILLSGQAVHLVLPALGRDFLA